MIHQMKKKNMNCIIVFIKHVSVKQYNYFFFYIMSTLSVTNDVNNSFPWWAILLIVLGVIILAIVSVVSGHFISKKIRHENAVKNVLTNYI